MCVIGEEWCCDESRTIPIIALEANFFPPSGYYHYKSIKKNIFFFVIIESFSSMPPPSLFLHIDMRWVYFMNIKLLLLTKGRVGRRCLI